MRLPVALLTVALPAVLVGCSRPDQVPSAAPTGSEAPQTAGRVVRVETTRIEPTAFEDMIQLTGAVEANSDATLSAQAGGTLVSLLPLGSRASQGDVLARLDAEMVAATLEQARAQAEVARAQAALADGLFRRQEPLYRDSIISDIEFENVRSQRIQAQAEVTRAEATVRQVEKQLANTRLVAPFDGTVEEHFVEQGEQVLPGSPVLRIVNTRVVRVVAGVPERYAADVAVGTPARVHFQGAADGDREGTVTFAGQVIDPQNRTFRIELDLPNPDASLKPAMIANLQLTRVRLEDQLVVPQTAILRDENAESVFVVVQRDGTARAERRTVTTGPSYGGRVVIESGLEPCDHVITVGQTNVTEGDAVVVDASSARTDP